MNVRGTLAWLALIAFIGSHAWGAPALKTKRAGKRRRAPASVEATVNDAATTNDASNVNATKAAGGGGSTRPIFVRVGLALAQEAIDVSAPAGTATMETQLQSLAVAATYVIPFARPRWSHTYAVEGNYGFAKGKANGKMIGDQVKGQTFYSLGIQPGLNYVTSPASRVGLSLPFVMRQIKWQVGDEGFDPDRDSSFSIGLMGLYETRFSVRSSLIVSATYQHLWQSTTFGLAYQRRLR